MKRITRIAAMLGLAAATTTPGIMAADENWIGEANNAFAVELYSRLAGAGQGNLFLSPHSIHTALAMAHAGARGQTADEMGKVLHLPSTDHAHEDLGGFLKSLNDKTPRNGKPRGYQLSVANSLWAQTGSKFLPEFLDLAKNHYGAGLDEVDFKSDSETAHKTINAWVERQTNNKIIDLIKSGMLNAMTRLVLCNAIYFKGTWVAEFDKAMTCDAPFHLSNEKTEPVSMMNRTGDYGYMETKELQALKLPYVQDELSMIILLPKQVDGLAALERSFTAPQLSSWFSKLRSREVRVSLPKFKLRSEFELGKTLTALGMSAAFSRAADFSGMTGQKDFEISEIVHQAFVEVNEEGTEAAAATALVLRTLSMDDSHRPAIFRADHPFVFLIRHEKTGAILFLGRVTNPKGV